MRLFGWLAHAADYCASPPILPIPALCSCLESFLAYTKQDNMTVHDAFVELLQSCGWTITSSNTGTRAAPEATAQAMARLQEVGAAKLAAAPQAARRSLIQSTVQRYERPAPKVERRVFSQALVVKA